MRLVKRDYRIGTQIVKRRKNPLVSSGGDDSFGSEQFGSLYREFAGHAGRPQNQNSLTRSKLGAPDERSPGGEAGVQDGCGCVVVNLRRQWKAPRTRHHRALRHRPVGRTRHPEQYSRSIFQHTGSVGSAHHGKAAVAGVMRAARHLLVDWFERRGADFDQDFSHAGNGIRERLAARRLPEGVQHGGVHLWKFRKDPFQWDSTSWNKLAKRTGSIA
jgi:hypothetical protein